MIVETINKKETYFKLLIKMQFWNSTFSNWSYFCNFFFYGSLFFFYKCILMTQIIIRQ